MSCISKIKNYTSYTSTEKKLIDYILKHKETVIYDSVQLLAGKVGTSPAAIIRFSKKMGYQGFSDLKLALAAEQKSEISTETFLEQINTNDSLETIIKKNNMANLMLVEETYKLIDIKTIQHAVDQLKRANQIFLFGTGASGNCCLDLAQKLARVNFHAIYHIDPHTQLTAGVHITDQDVAIGISYSGATKEVTSAIQYAKSRGAHTIAITQHNKNELHKLADSILVLPYQENEFR